MYDRLILMFQKEVAERLAAAPNTEAYGRLSVLTQWLCTVEKLFDLSPAAFTPPPKVTSTVVRLMPRPARPDAPGIKTFEKLTGAAFGQRRKMLKSTLKGFPGLLARAGIDETRRAETLSVDEFVHLAKCLEQG